MKNIKTGSFLLLINIMAVFTFTAHSAAAQQKPIHNDIFWNTREDTPIFSWGGGIFKFTDPKDNKEKYFWYGVEYTEAAAYRRNAMR